jgi:uncharacterized membrane protein
MNAEPESRPATAAPKQTAPANNLAVTVILFLVLFLLFAGGLYVMGLYTVAWWLFLVGLGMSLLALFGAFQVVPDLLT